MAAIEARGVVDHPGIVSRLIDRLGGDTAVAASTFFTIGLIFLVVFTTVWAAIAGCVCLGFFVFFVLRFIASLLETALNRAGKASSGT